MDLLKNLTRAKDALCEALWHLDNLSTITIDGGVYQCAICEGNGKTILTVDHFWNCPIKQIGGEIEALEDAVFNVESQDKQSKGQ